MSTHFLRYAVVSEDPADLPGALVRGLHVVREERRQVLLNVICKKP